jgi:hypothetical protein
MTIDPSGLLPLLPVLLIGLAIVLVAYALWSDYQRPKKPIAVDHEHSHHGLIWTLLILMLPGICGPPADKARAAQ